MRTRDSIEDSAFRNASDEAYMQHMMLEVLLDIRDLISPAKLSKAEQEMVDTFVRPQNP